MRRAFLLALFVPLSLAAQKAAKPHPLPVVGATRERFEAVDAVTIGDRIFAVERTSTGGWLRVYDASDVANPFEIREATAPIVGRPIGVAGEGGRVLVASITGDTTRVRLTLFDVSRPERSRWSGAASLGNNQQRDGIDYMTVVGDRGVVQTGFGSVIEIDLAELERQFARATHGDETSGAARAIARSLAERGSVFGTGAVVVPVTDTVYRDGARELWSSWDFILHDQLRAYRSRAGTLVSLLHGQWDLDLVDGATRRIVFQTRRPNKQVESLTAPDSADVLVNDLVRVGSVGDRRIAVFNATIMGPTHREKAYEGAAFIDITDPRSPRVLGTDRRSSIDTSSLRYGWRSYARDAVFARDAIVEVGDDSSFVARFDASGRMTALAATGKFVGRLVPGPDGTVLELSGESAWRAYNRITRADTTVPAIRIRSTVPRVAVRDAPVAIAVDAQGRTTAANRLRFEVVTPLAASDPAQIAIGALTLPATRRGGLLDATLPAGAALGTGPLGLTLRADTASGRWIALAAAPVALAANLPRGFVTLDDPFTGATIVVPVDSASAPFADVRLRARLARDTNATVFVAPGTDGAAPRVTRRDRGWAEVVASRGMSLASYPAPAAVTAIAALRHVGSSGREQLSLCLRDALGKRVQQELDAALSDTLREVPCGDAGALREWLTRRGLAIVEGRDAAVVVTRSHLAPFDTLVERTRWRKWTSARAEVQVDTTPAWLEEATIAREDGDSARIGEPAPFRSARPLTGTERAEIARALGDAALLGIIEYASTDSTDSTVAVIRRHSSAAILPLDSGITTIYVQGDDWGSTVVGDLQAGRFVPRWEGWSYGDNAGPALLDLDGDSIPELVYSNTGTDAKGHITSQQLWAWDHNGRELTRTRNYMSWDLSQAQPLVTDMEDEEYCESDCGGFVIGRPGPDGTRPIIARDGRWVLREHQYVFQPNPPKPVPKKKPVTKRATAKPKH